MTSASWGVATPAWGVQWSFRRVRPIFADAHAESRYDPVFEIDAQVGYFQDPRIMG